MECDWYLSVEKWKIKQMKVIDFMNLSGYSLITEKTEKFFLASVLLKRLLTPFA